MNAPRERAAGILLHITSLPGRHGCGTLGVEARRFADELAEAGQRLWQILPVNPVCGHLGYSPYSSPSTFAGSDLLVSLDDLVADGLLASSDLESPPFPEPADFNDFDAARVWRRPRLEKAGRALVQSGPEEMRREYAAFRGRHEAWLEDYALFMALAEQTATFDWTSWEPG
jgi:4-alpha-glucanotransferase